MLLNIQFFKMRQWFLVVAIIGGLTILSACGEDNSTEKKVEKVSQKLDNEDAIEAEIAAIEEEIVKADLVAHSLSYAKENGEAIEVLAHLSADNVILKIEEKFSDGNGKNSGAITYYLKDKYPFVTKELFEDLSNPTAAKFVERVSYYDKKGKAISTKEKRVNYQEELPNVSFISVPLKTCSIDRAMRVLEQKGDFETTFQGFAITESLNYLIVGQPGEDGYSSALRVEVEDNFIKDALRNQQKYLNKKCRVSFQIAENSGFEYQLYTGASWSEK
jgi:hypothetical protein